MSDFYIGSNISFGPCSVRGKEAELRPYGKGGSLICFDCGMRDEEETRRQFSKVLNVQTTETRKAKKHHG